MEQTAVPSVNGVVGESLEETLENLEKVNNPGMLETDRMVLEIIRERTD